LSRGDRDRAGDRDRPGDRDRLGDREEDRAVDTEGLEGDLEDAAVERMLVRMGLRRGNLVSASTSSPSPLYVPFPSPLSCCGLSLSTLSG
jgi:hypothetical protein